MIATNWIVAFHLPSIEVSNLLPAGLDRGAQPEDRELAPDDHQRHPRRSAVDGHQRDQRGRDEQLVGGRVEERAEPGGHAPAAGQPAVEPVGRGGHHEHDRGGV